jgi:hypothetical protein
VLALGFVPIAVACKDYGATSVDPADGAAIPADGAPPDGDATTNPDAVVVEGSADARSDVTAPPGTHVVFVTSLTYAGDAVSDPALCNKVAMAAVLAGNYKAWLSYSNTSPSTALADYGPWARFDGTLVAKDKSDLLSGAIHAPIDLDESGNVVSSAAVWTGTATDGSPSGNDCMGWMSPIGYGSGGATDQIDARWTNVGAGACGASAHVYCFAQPP